MFMLDVLSNPNLMSHKVETLIKHEEVRKGPDQANRLKKASPKHKNSLEVILVQNFSKGFTSTLHKMAIH